MLVRKVSAEDTLLTRAPLSGQLGSITFTAQLVSSANCLRHRTVSSESPFAATNLCPSFHLFGSLLVVSRKCVQTDGRVCRLRLHPQRRVLPLLSALAPAAVD